MLLFRPRARNSLPLFSYLHGTWHSTSRLVWTRLTGLILVALSLRTAAGLFLTAALVCHGHARCQTQCQRPFSCCLDDVEVLYLGGISPSAHRKQNVWSCMCMFSSMRHQARAQTERTLARPSLHRLSTGNAFNAPHGLPHSLGYLSN